MTHRWTHSTPRVRPDGERIEQGDTFAPTAQERRVWRDRMEELDTCDTVMDNGEVCTRVLPCRYHSPDDTVTESADVSDGTADSDDSESESDAGTDGDG